MNVARILIIEDEASMLTGLVDSFTMSGYEVITATDGRSGLELACLTKLNLIILDIMLPKLDGFSLCERLRMEKIDVPIIMLTAKGREEDKVQGLELGADDYVTKPFSIRELLARVKAVLRRSRRETEEIETYSFADVIIDFKAHCVTKGGETVNLAPLEFEVLRLLIKHKGETLSRERFLTEVWGYDRFPSTRTVDTHILNLRRKLEDNPNNTRYIKTVHGVGYRFDENPSTD